MKKMQKILTIFFLFLLIGGSISYAEMVTFNQRVTVNEVGKTDKGGSASDFADWGLAAGIEFNSDGTKMFVSFAQNFVDDGSENPPPINPKIINTYNLSTPYDISTSTYAGDSERCTFDESDVVNQLYDLEISSDGMKILVASRRAQGNADNDKAYVLSLTSPYDISSCQITSQTTNLDSDAFLLGSNAGRLTNLAQNRIEGIEINPEGTKLFLSFTDVPTNNVGARIYEFNLSTPYDLSASSMSLNLNAGIALSEDSNTGVEKPNSIRFSSNGKRLFLLSHQSGGQRVTQISLTNAYDTSSFVVDGSFRLNTASYNNSQPRGIAFSPSGLKMYLTKDRSGNPDSGSDQIIEYDLVCPFTIITGKCPSITENKDRTGMALAQIEIAKRNIDYSTNTVLNRLKWIRRNKDKQNLTNLNVDFNFTNQKLASLTQIIKTSTNNKKVKNNKTEQEIFYWSEGSVAIGRVGNTNISSTKKIDTNRITLGADKFVNNRGLRGLAFSVGRNNLDVGTVGSNLDTDSYNITYYETSPIKDDSKFLDKVFGYSKLNSNLLTILDNNKLEADRSGHQLYGSIKFKDEIEKNNFVFIPSGRFDVGHTVLGAYEETGAGAIAVEKQHIRTRKIRAGLAAVENLSNKEYTFKKHGKIEYVADIERSSDFKYSYVSSGDKRFNDKLNSGALHNINGEVGIDLVLPENFSIFLIYERNQALGAGHTDNLHIALGYLPNKKTNYSIQLDGTDDTKTNYVISKNINDFLIDFKLTNHLMRPEEYEEASFNLRRKF